MFTLTRKRIIGILAASAYVLFQTAEMVLRPSVFYAWLAIDIMGVGGGLLLTALAFLWNRLERDGYKRHLEKTVGWKWIDGKDN
jgi:hypothetical protein